MTGDVREGTDPDKAKEWNELEITFTWEAGEAALGTGSVTVSYHPVSDDAAKIPRYVAGPTFNDVIEIEDCITTLLFPFVTNQQGYNTGVAISNTSEGSGSCTISFHGPNAPDDYDAPKLDGEGHMTFQLSTEAPGFQGYLIADCEFRGAYGFAFITDGEPKLAQGYLAVCTNCGD